MKLPTNQTFPGVSLELMRFIGKATTQINSVTEGKASAFHTAATAAPTTGTWGIGDTVKNSAPSEAGTAGSKYVITGWICTAAGTPGTWLQMRTLTGN